MKEYNQRQSAALEPLSDELDEAERDLQRERVKLDRLSASLGDASAAAAAIIQRQITTAAERMTVLEKRCATLKRRMAASVHTLDEAQTLAQIRKIKAGLATADFAKRKATLAIFGVRCQIEHHDGKRRARITFDILESVAFHVEVQP